MEERKRPYLGKCVTSNGETYVVLFPANEQNYGIIVMSEVTNNPNLQIGVLSDFDETHFEYLNSEEQITLFND